VSLNNTDPLTKRLIARDYKIKSLFLLTTSSSPARNITAKGNKKSLDRIKDWISSTFTDLLNTLATATKGKLNIQEAYLILRRTLDISSRFLLALLCVPSFLLATFKARLSLPTLRSSVILFS